MRYLWILILLCLGCIDKSDRSRHFGNATICDGHYAREIFIVFQGGVYGGDTYTDYVTDSATFRTYMGIHNDASGYIYRCSDGSLIVEKFENSVSGKAVIISTRRMRLDSLREVDPL